MALVRFRTGGGEYAVGVDAAREVRAMTALTALPSPVPAVAGVLQRDDGPVSVLTSLGSGSGQILVLESADRAFGLLVEEVRGVVRVAEDVVGPPPRGQDAEMIRGTLTLDGTLVLLVDVPALARLLDQGDR